MASAVGVLTLAMFMVGLIPFLSADPSAGAGLNSTTPDFSVNRSLKGDRLPLAADVSRSAVSRDELRSQTPMEIPVGCDAAFSPISAPTMAYIFGRCTT
jgi:hypothetical protein